MACDFGVRLYGENFNMMLLPPHDRISCNICFDNKTVSWGKTEREVNNWKIEANAGAWGSRDPIILVLGVSKGPKPPQLNPDMNHEDIPFKTEREYLSKYLRLLGLLEKNESVDSKIRAEENIFAFGSIIRCGVGMWSPEKMIILRLVM